VADEIQYEQLADDGAAQSSSDLERLGDVEVEVSVEIGRRRLTIAETLELAPGSLIALGRPAGDPVDLLVNGRRIGRGEVVVIDDEFGIRVTEVVSPRRRAESSRAAAGGEPASTGADGEPVA
jgi:flagellar motor switch protein FliN/FliY